MTILCYVVAVLSGDLYQCNMCGNWSTEPVQTCSNCR